MLESVRSHDLDVFPGLPGKATNERRRKYFLKHLWQLGGFLFCNVPVIAATYSWLNIHPVVMFCH